MKRVLAGLRGYLADGDAITGISTLSTGHSNETYLIEGLDRILRTPPCGPGLLPPYDMAKQHAVMKELAGLNAGPPVPEVHELCEDPEVIGDEFFVMSRAYGTAFEYEVPDWLLCATENARSRMWAEWLCAVTRLHNLEALDVLGAPVAPRQAAQHWRQVSEQAESPRLIAINEELERNPPVESGRPAVVHGDPKIANCLWSNGNLVALVDWELACNGEPLADLGYMLSLWFTFDSSIIPPAPGFDLPGVPTREEWISAWERQTGRSASGVLRHEAAAHGKIGAILALGAHLYETGQSSDERFAAWGEASEQCIRAAETILSRS
ncbi:MAG: phosphotransferase family protein [Ilumatobacteraceae bacterium]